LPALGGVAGLKNGVAKTIAWPLNVLWQLLKIQFIPSKNDFLCVLCGKKAQI